MKYNKNVLDKSISIVRRAGATALALVVLGASAAGLFAARPVAADQALNRSIEMSDAGASGGSITSGVGSGANVSYSISFDIAGSYTMKSYVVDFCSDSPLIGDTCTAPTGLSLSSATATGGNTAGWTLTKTASQVKASNATGIAAPDTITLELGGITNPSTVGTFYARIYTYSDTTWGGYSGPTSIGTDVDYGGIALSTANSVSVSARVQEQLTFCVSGASMGTNCSGMTTPALIIGHGSPTVILDGSQVDTAAAYMQTSTNAQNGAVVRMRNSNTCGGLSSDGGTNCNLPAAGGTAISFAAGTANYGMNVSDGTGSVGSVDPTAPYDQNASSKYAMSTADVTSTYGDQIAGSTGVVNNANNTLTFAAAASNTTPAGIYTATMGLIATATF